jgi:serine/threonine-protein kinase
VTAAASHSASSPLAPGYKLDRYELLCPIAEGGMASVWAARQRGKHGFEKLVAIKTILPKFASDIRFQEMFLDEARIASRIEHLNVAQIFDLGEEHEILYLVMEYVDGDALSKLNRACQRKAVKIPTGVILRVLADACAGLHDAHELKDAEGRPLEIVHRDVSPHNILVSTKGIAKLIDFGIAKARSRVGTDTNSGVLKGKIQYMAPEQALGRPVDRRADLWAVGAILYHMLTGKPPYEGDNHLATLHLLGSGRPPVPLPPNVHGAIVAIVRKALSYAPENRHPTAAAMRDAIEAAMRDANAQCTSADVAAFAAEHLAERAERRRHAIDLAVAAAAERRRVEELLKPPSERTSSGVTAAGRAGTLPPPPGSVSSVPPPAQSREVLTAAEVPAAKGSPSAPSIEAVAKLTPRLSEPPGSSYGMFGSAVLDALAPAPRSRRGAMIVGGIVIVAGVVAASVSFRMARPTPAEPVAASPPPVAAPPAEPPPPAPSASTIPTVAATSLPKVTPPVPPPPGAPIARPPVVGAPPRFVAPPPPPPQAPKPPAKKQQVDDGF